ncbi:carboxypeptidase-like regulatory domain-containing protein [Pontibacter sp. SGAir0037]|uniref:carboxypeptidase-like regulatory domain-containing protein n=1 Tax=Pontibacter sp. SGAir0037 TaxID=2571030 RepID=UPI0010CD3E5E|nr:carboxypeptidase-like regulatory domain-containing protein [Pontibacter sp. SGAir0037]QCR21455.1 hypothetical protein C1N53_03215 [Pontibacter sp. SGAir0037]
MERDNIRLYQDEDNHVPLELLRQYHENTLPEAETYEVEKHLLHCELCTDVVEGLVLSDRTQTEAAVNDINYRLKAKLHLKEKKKRAPRMLWADWRVAAAILALVGATAVFFFYLFSQLNQAKNTITQSAPAPVVPAPAATPAPAAAPPVVAVPESASSASGTKPTPTKTGTVPGSAANTAKAPAAPLALAAADVVGIQQEADLTELETSRVLAAPAKVFIDSSLLQAPAVAGVIEGQKQLQQTLVPSDFNTNMPRAAASNLKARKSSAFRQLTGKVMSSNGEALPGVAVTVKGAATGASTDANGNYSLLLPQDKETLLLQFSYIGFERQEVKVDSAIVAVNVNLTEDTRSLQEVVVVELDKRREPKLGKATAPQPAAGMRAYQQYIQENLKYPSGSTAGLVVVAFTVQEDGKLSNFRLTKGLTQASNAEAIRLLQEGPAWTPARQNGKPIAQEVKVRIRFRKR